MTRFVKLRSVPGAFYLAVLALGLIGPLAGCGNLGKPLQAGGGATTRKIGAITVSVAWPDRSRLIPLASNSIRVTVRDSSNTIVAQKLLVRPADITGTPTTASFTAENLQVPNTFTITADAFPTAAGTGTIQSTGSTSSTLTLDNPTDRGRAFTIGSTIKSVVISIPPSDGGTTSQNLGKGRTRLYQATAFDGPAGTGSVVLTTSTKWKWEIVSPGIGSFQGANGDGTFNGGLVTYVAGDPGSSLQTTTIRVTETESSDDNPSNPALYTTTTTAQTAPLGLSTASTWARFRGTAQNTGLGTAGTSIGSSVSQVWSGPAKVGPRNVVFSSGVIDSNGVFFIGAYSEATGTSGRLYSISPDKSLITEFAAGGRIESSPVVGQDGTIYFGSYDDASTGGFVYGIRRDPTTGAMTQLWRTALTGPVFGTPALDKDGYLYVATAGADQTLYKLDSLNGKLVANWQMKADTPILTSPALSVDEATVYVISSGDTLADGSRVGAKLFAVATATGTSKWVYSTGDKSVVMSSPVVSGGRVYFGTLEGLLFAVSESTGTEAWAKSFDAEAQIYSTVAVAANGATLYFAT